MSDTSNFDVPSAHISNVGEPEKNTLALVGFIFSIVGTLASITLVLATVGVPVAIIGLVISVLGLLKTKNYAPEHARKTFAIIGIVTSLIAVVIGAVLAYVSYFVYTFSGDCLTLDDQAAIQQCITQKLEIQQQ
ncbi:hypothetical protein [Corynebacterium sp. HS2168-gen11]|uniref:hypothetical protein n=1 Tax=Corynebacterium sp. HS2168-gen11 TaxID=2974027 RepID=UPI00216B471D|nr:hypothetical protein [Corynebacterium sp. HS2168-gen11]MCS4535228.1 hypothetical protein [Corynebacterium sp. HS2168-gen11]